MNQLGIESLHSHTLLSDGKLTHSEVLDVAEKLGFSVIVFTDHDGLPDEKLLEELKKKKTSVKWLVGIEISAGLPKELGGGPDGPHMLGLFVDPFNKELLEYCKKTQQQRLERLGVTVKNLQNLGFEISEEECKEQAKGSTVGQPHIVAALKAKEKNLELMDQFVQKMKQAADKDPEIKKKYDQMIDLGETQYPYSLLMSSDAYLPVSAPHKFWLDFDQSVALIRQAGGLAFVAHYTYTKKDLPWEMLEKLLAEDRVDGAETVYGLWNLKTNFRKEVDQDREKIRQLLKKYNKLAVGGADSHYEKDLYAFAEAKELSGETVGMLEKILEKTGRKT